MHFPSLIYYPLYCIFSCWNCTELLRRSSSVVNPSKTCASGESSRKTHGNCYASKCTVILFQDELANHGTIKLLQLVNCYLAQRWADILFMKYDSSIFRQFSNPVCGSWKIQASSLWASTEPNLFHQAHGETTYRVGWLSENATGLL